MKKITLFSRSLALLAAAGMTLASFAANADTTIADLDIARQIRPQDYPALDDKQLGNVRRVIKLSRQLPGDWSGMSDDVWAVAERTQQFQLAYMAAALGLVQHQYTPAYREAYREAMHALIQKMTVPDVWESWFNSSRAGTSASDPDSPDLDAGWLDPIRKYNIMLKGYLLQAGAMYSMLYRDGRYDRPDAFTFNYVANTWGNGPVVFRYSLPDVARIVHQEYVDNNYEGVLCEPNRIFPACNQPPILGLINVDQVYGTRYAADVMPKFKAAWQRKNYTLPDTKQFAAVVFVKQDAVVGAGGPVLDGWAGAWMNAWDPEYMKSIYEAQKKIYVPLLLSSAYAQNVPPHSKGLLSLGFGQVAFMAAELGDQDSRAKLLDYAEHNFGPVWEDGTYYYPRNDDYQTDAQGNSHGVGSWTGNVLLALARLDKGDGFLKLYRNPWGKAEFDAPQITEVDYVSTNVSQAYYDAKQDALIVTLKPGPVKVRKTRFAVANLDPNKSYVLVKDGVALGTISRVSGAKPVAGVTVRSDGKLTIETDLDADHSFVLVGPRRDTPASARH